MVAESSMISTRVPARAIAAFLAAPVAALDQRLERLRFRLAAAPTANRLLNRCSKSMISCASSGFS